MRTAVATVIAVALLSASPIGQETKPVPKNSVRVTVGGCTRDYIFTAGRRMEGEPDSGDIPEGMRLRMNGPKKMMADIRAHEGSMVAITGLMKKGQRGPDGVGIGGGVRVGPGPSGGGLGIGIGSSNQITIDVEAWRPLRGDCPSQ
jgi:hypothetical protein